jgi:hypothetical protein
MVGRLHCRLPDKLLPAQSLRLALLDDQLLGQRLDPQLLHKQILQLVLLDDRLHVQLLQEQIRLVCKIHQEIEVVKGHCQIPQYSNPNLDLFKFYFHFVTRAPVTITRAMNKQP